MPRFRLRYRQRTIALPPDELFVIGRGSDCDLTLDDPLLARRHARLVVVNDEVYVEALRGPTGVMVDGAPIGGRQRLRHGSRLTVGAQEMTLVDARLSTANTPDSGAPTSGPMPAAPPSSDVPTPASGVPAGPDSVFRLDLLQLLGGVAHKALALGQFDEAERILCTRLLRILEMTRMVPDRMPPEVVDQAARFAARLAGVTAKGLWVDYVIALYAAQGRPFPTALGDDLYAALRKVGPIDKEALGAYIRALEGRPGALGPAERFLLRPLEEHDGDDDA
ncbi:MAG TPA: FHA domain-containing protein [Polyangiaceae bacterium]|nr:FHA domain-containing protein [Polyangiaceae bacterium]